MIIEWQRLRQPSHYLRAVSVYVPRLENRPPVFLGFAWKANSFARGQVALKRGRYAAREAENRV